MDNPLETLLGRTAARLALYLFHHGEVYATGAAQELGIHLNAVQRQLQNLESAGFLTSKLAGRTRLYSITPKNPAARKFQEFIGVFYEGMTLPERESMFRVRRRPRRSGKPVKGR